MSADYLTAAQVGELVGLSSETILRAWRSGWLAGYAVNQRVIRFTRTDIEAWLATGRREASRPAPRSATPGCPVPSRQRRRLTNVG